MPEITVNSSSSVRDSTVSVVFDARVVKYPALPPFHPEINYPEIKTTTETDPGNFVYGMVRKLFYNLGYDIENFGTAAWNPLKHLISPGDKVVIKPNLAKHEHHLGNEGLLSTITHGSVLRPIVDYINIALKGNGKIIICDTPVEDSDFKKMCDVTGIGDTVIYLRKRGYPIELIDLRKYITKYFAGKSSKQFQHDGDPDGYLVVDLEDQSEFHELDSTRQNYHTLADHSVDHYDPFCREPGMPNKHHHSGRHEYLISRTILNADVVISVPKLKTHGKAGVTLNLKNMVGIVSGKDYMPHHRPGNSPDGDAFPSPPPEQFVKHRFIRRKIARSFLWLRYLIGDMNMERISNFFRKAVLERFWPVKKFEQERVEWGDWYGNDTLWRTILDLNKILLYCDKGGNLKSTRQRKHLSVIDGIIGQEGQGPTSGTPVHTSLLLAGEDPVAVDTVACGLMGFDIDNIRVLTKTARMKHFLGTCDRNLIEIKSSDYHDIKVRQFETPRGWEVLKKRTL